MRRVLWVRIGVSVVLGVVLTLGFAWGSGLWKLRPGWLFPPELTNPTGIMVSYQRNDEWIAETKHTLWASEWRCLNRAFSRATQPTRTELDEFRRAAPWWASPETLDPTGVYAVGTMAFGVPVRCMRHHATIGSDTTSNHDSWSITSAGGRSASLPTAVLPAGFVFNTVVWGVVSFGLIGVPGAVRGLIRRYRGQCALCGYDLVGITDQPCPECGREPRSSRRARRAIG